jgi:hypothetical protein
MLTQSVVPSAKKTLPPAKTATSRWVWAVVDAEACSGGAVDAVLAHERPAREYIAAQGGRSGSFHAEAHALLPEVPAPAFGLLARSARFIEGLERAS